MSDPRWNDPMHECCPHCDEPQPCNRFDEHVSTEHADIPPCTATLDREHGSQDHCALRAWHRTGHGEYGEWHVTAQGPEGRTVWNDSAIGAHPHRVAPTSDSSDNEETEA